MKLCANDASDSFGYGPPPSVVDFFRVMFPRLSVLYEPLPHPAGEDGAEGVTVRLPILDAALSGLELASLLPEALRRSVRRRQVAWLGGRLCAEHALERLGEVSCGVARGASGEPVWPRGIAGSITHTDLAAHAIALRRADGAGIGIDSEFLVDEQALAAISTICCSKDERETWLARPDDPLRTTLLFAAKEAFYKAAWPVVRRFVDFDEVAVQEWHESSGTIVLRLAPTLVAGDAIVRYCVGNTGDVVHARVTLDAELVNRLAEKRIRAGAAACGAKH